MIFYMISYEQYLYPTCNLRRILCSTEPNSLWKKRVNFSLSRNYDRSIIMSAGDRWHPSIVMFSIRARESVLRAHKFRSLSSTFVPEWWNQRLNAELLFVILFFELKIIRKNNFFTWCDFIVPNVPTWDSQDVWAKILLVFFCYKVMSILGDYF